jgi:hypothetical protein
MNGAIVDTGILSEEWNDSDKTLVAVAFHISAGNAAGNDRRTE